MAFSEETAARVQSLYREHLEGSFQGTLRETLRFDPIRVELTRNQFSTWDALHVTVVYDGGHGLLDPAKLNRISSLMADRAAELGIEDTILESYVHRLEYTGQREFVEDPLEQAGDNSKRWQELLNIAREPLGRRDPPTGTELNLAVDRCYFAAYHALCQSNAQALAGGLRTRRPGDWSRVYMGMDEGIIVARLRQYRHQGPRPVRDFGTTFAILQEHRDRAMERPGSTFLPSEVALAHPAGGERHCGAGGPECGRTAFAGHQPAGRKGAWDGSRHRRSAGCRNGFDRMTGQAPSGTPRTSTSGETPSRSFLPPSGRPAGSRNRRNRNRPGNCSAWPSIS